MGAGRRLSQVRQTARKLTWNKQVRGKAYERRAVKEVHVQRKGEHTALG